VIHPLLEFSSNVRAEDLLDTLCMHDFWIIIGVTTLLFLLLGMFVDNDGTVYQIRNDVQ